MTKKLSIIFAATALASCDAGNGKNDIIGFMPGMKKAAIHALADSHQWKCENGYPLKNFSKTEETCHTTGGEMRVVYASNMEGWPVSALQFAFSPGQQQQAVIQNQVAAISNQYGKKPDRVTRIDGDDDIMEAVWNLDNGNVLILGNMGILEMQNRAIVMEDDKASGRNAIQANPTPKF
jgi:hypothetical protein